MTQARNEQAPPVLQKDVWYNIIFPLLPKSDLYVLSSVSKEARQLVFAYLFKQKDFYAHINNDIECLDRAIAIRSTPGQPAGFETALHAAIGNTPPLVSMTCLPVASVAIAVYALKEVLKNPDSTRLALIAGYVAVIASTRLAFVLDDNKTAIETDHKVALHQQKMHRKKYVLSYLRDELPGLTFAEHRLFAPRSGTNHDDAVTTPKIVDKSDKYYVETFYSKWKYALNDIYVGYQDHREYERKYGAKQ